MAATSQNRVTGRNMHATITAQNLSGGDPGNLSDLTVSGFLDRVQATFTETFNTYSPLGQETSHDQPVDGYWELTATGGDWKAILFALSSQQEAARKNKNPIPLFKMTLIGYSPDDGTKVINWTFGKGTMRQATFDMNGLNNAITSDAQLRFRTFDRG